MLVVFARRGVLTSHDPFHPYPRPCCDRDPPSSLSLSLSSQLWSVFVFAPVVVVVE